MGLSIRGDIVADGDPGEDCWWGDYDNDGYPDLYRFRLLPGNPYSLKTLVSPASVCWFAGLRQEFPRLLFDEGDVCGHVFLERRGVMLEINGDDSFVALALEFLECVGAVGLAFANDRVARVKIALLEHVLQVKADDASLQFPQAFDRVQV
jgi:hypothetical protein